MLLCLVRLLDEMKRLSLYFTFTYTPAKLQAEREREREKLASKRKRSLDSLRVINWRIPLEIGRNVAI